MPDFTASEMWKPISGYEERYEISTLGRVRSLPKGNILKPQSSGRGYAAVALSQYAIVKTRYVHHLVAEAFLGVRPEGFDICHINGDIADPRATNLRYGTHHSNMRDSLAHGTHRSLERTHCTKGHEMTEDNVHRYHYKSADGGPRYRDRCKTCLKAKSRRDYEIWKQRQASAA